jgi:hypothetical protein
MTDHDPDPMHHADADAPGHDAGHGEHGHDEGSLGPIDWGMWGAGILGVAAALAVLAGFVASTQFLFNA